MILINNELMIKNVQFDGVIDTGLLINLFEQENIKNQK